MKTEFYLLIINNIKKNYMSQKFKKVLQDSKKNDTIIIGEQTFSNEIILNESIQCSIFWTLTFFDVKFKNVDFTGSTLVKSTFKSILI